MADVQAVNQDPRAAGLLAVYRHMNEAQLAKALEIYDKAEALQEAIARNCRPEAVPHLQANVSQTLVGVVGAVI